MNYFTRKFYSEKLSYQEMDLIRQEYENELNELSKLVHGKLRLFIDVSLQQNLLHDGLYDEAMEN